MFLPSTVPPSFFSHNFGYISVEYLNYDVCMFGAEPCGKLIFFFSAQLSVLEVITAFFHLLSFLCSNTKDLNSSLGYLNLFSVCSVTLIPLRVSLL